MTYESLPDGEPMCDQLAAYGEDGRWYWCDDDEYDNECRVPITAWMHLPGPYRGGKRHTDCQWR